MRVVPKKNYVILFILTIIVVFITLASATIYKNYQTKKTSYLSRNIINVNAAEIENYCQENGLVIVYVADKYDIENDKQEKKLLNNLENLDLKKYFVYLSADDTKNTTYLKNKYSIEYNDKRIILLIEDNKLIDKLEYEDNIVDNVIKFLSVNGVEND